MGRTQAMHVGRKLASYFDEALHEVGYQGPLAVAGGYIRDIALARDPKDLDIFLDGGFVTNMGTAEAMAEAVIGRIKGAVLDKIIPCYGGWAEDIQMVVQIELHLDFQEFVWLDKCPIPLSIDIVVLKRDRMVLEGYTAKVVNDRHNQETFLKACLQRVDIRLNAIGATRDFVWAHPQWDWDAYKSNLTVQYARREGMGRIAKRLERLLQGKFQGWTIKYERADGEVQDTPVHVAADDEIAGLRVDCVLRL